MKAKILRSSSLIVATLCIAGCSSITGSRTDSQGNKLAISSNRFLWQSQGLHSTVTDANGFQFTLDATVDSPDTQAINATFSGLNGLVKTIAPAMLASSTAATNTPAGTNATANAKSKTAALEIEPPVLANH